jgi:hypothetical protein
MKGKDKSKFFLFWERVEVIPAKRGKGRHFEFSLAPNPPIKMAKP